MQIQNLSLAMTLLVSLTAFGCGTSVPSTKEYESDFGNLIPEPKRSSREKSESKQRQDAMIRVMHLSEGDDFKQALSELKSISSNIDRRQVAWSVVNNRIWTNTLLKNGEFAEIVDAYRSLSPVPKDDTPVFVSIADIEMDGTPDFPVNINRARIVKYLQPKGYESDMPSETTPQGLLALGYLIVGQDYHMEANFEAARWYYERAARLAPNSPFCAWIYARALNESGHGSRAGAVIAKSAPTRNAWLKKNIEDELRISKTPAARTKE